MYNYETKPDLKSTSCVNTPKIAKSAYLASLKLDVYKLEHVTFYLIKKLKVDAFIKEVAKKFEYNKDLDKKIETPDVAVIVTNTMLN